jgi:tryptophan synthase beta chain
MTGVVEPAPASRRRRSILAEIAERRRWEVTRQLAGRTVRELAREAARAPAPRPLADALAAPGLHLIAEVKRRSPSAGELARPDLDPLTQARAYLAGGARAISVLCEPHWFGGSLEDLTRIRAAVPIPVLAKEFVVDPRQLPLLRSAGADAVLLIASLHPPRRLARLVSLAFDLGLEPLVEIHRADELPAVLASGARVVGINQRDLRSLAVDPGLARRLRPLVPQDRLVVAESGISQPHEVVPLRAIGVDAILVGEALMRAGDPTAAVRAFVARGAVPADLAAADRVPLVKICGVTDPVGVRAVVAAGADAIGLNLVPGTPRALSLSEAAALARLTRELRGASPRPRVVAVTVDGSPQELEAIVVALDPDVLQLSGSEPPELVARLPRPVWKAIHLPAGVGDGEDEARADPFVDLARRYLAAGAERILLDTAGGPHPGGTGRSVSRRLAAEVARQVPVVLAGGLDPATVGPALLEVPAVGVDVASGVEAGPGPAGMGRGLGGRSRRRDAGEAGGRPVKDPLRVALFVKRARAARFDRPTVPSRPTPVHPGLLEADAAGKWGPDRTFGGRFVPETLVAALEELASAYTELRDDPAFWAELRDLLATYAGRPTPLYRADALAGEVLDQARRLARTGGGDPDGLPRRLRLYLKREDLAHTGAHKINNALGQALLTRRLGKTRVIAETGAGQHGVATATACALLGLPCVVYMGAEDMERQAPNVLRMRALGAEVRPVTAGSATLKDAINEAMRDWVTNVATTHYVLGSAMGPHPYPTMVRDFQRVIGDEAAAQLAAAEGRLPDLAVACVGGGSNAIGLLTRFIGEPGVRLAVVEAAGEGLETGRHAAAIRGGALGILHGARSLLLQDADGQVREAHSISAGLDYPGIGPQISALHAAGRLEVAVATDAEAVAAARRLTRTEGILPALEPAHAVAALPGLLADALRTGHRWPEETIVLLGLSGRGDKDLAVLQRWWEGGDTIEAQAPTSPWGAERERDLTGGAPSVAARDPSPAAGSSRQEGRPPHRAAAEVRR